MHITTFLVALIALAKIHPLVNAFFPSKRYCIQRYIAPARAFDESNMKTSSDARAEDSTCQKLVHRYDSPFMLDVRYNQQLSPAALIILNTPIMNNDPMNDEGTLTGALKILWQKTSYRVCADGGANRLFDATVTNNSSSDETISKYLPDLITGDLDSLLPHVREYYEKNGVPIVRVEDQDYHDLDKALMAVEKWIYSTTAQSTSTDETKVFIYGGFGGRFDQEMGCMNALYVWGQKDTFQHTSMAVYGEETCAFLLPTAPTTNEIRIPFPDDKYTGDTKTHPQVGEGPSCGLIPLGGRCVDVLTTGLKWNLDGNMPLQFGGLVSSSNRIMDAVVTVKTSSPMIFTTEIVKNCNCP